MYLQYAKVNRRYVMSVNITVQIHKIIMHVFRPHHMLNLARL